MGIGFAGILTRLQVRTERLRLRAALAVLNMLHAATVKLGSQAQKVEFTAARETHNKEIGDQWESLHRRSLFMNVGLALSQWAAMEDLLIAIACLLLRTNESKKIGIVLYSIMNFGTWLGIITEIFSIEPLYTPLKPKWNKTSSKLRGLKDTRDRLAHNTIYDGERAATLTGDASLRPGRFDVRKKSQDFPPLNFDEISKFVDAVSQETKNLTSLLNAMTELLERETSQRKSPEPTSGPAHP